MDSTSTSHVAGSPKQHHGVFALHHLDELGVSEARARRIGSQSGRWDRGARRRLPHRRQRRCHGGATCSRRAGPAGRAPSRHIDRRPRSGSCPASVTTIVEITCPRWRRAQHDGLVVHETAALERPRHHRWSTASRSRRSSGRSSTCAAVCSRFTVDLAIDNALRRDLTTVDELSAMLRRARPTRAPRARGSSATLLADRDRRTTRRPRANAEQMLLARRSREHGLPEPERQFAIYDDDGNFVARPDLAYPRPQDRDRVRQLPAPRRERRRIVRDSRRRNAIVGARVARPGRRRPKTSATARAASSPHDVQDARRTREPASAIARIARPADASSMWGVRAGAGA